jgi:ParB-like chromosome segregation protein Spo0J
VKLPIKAIRRDFQGEGYIFDEKVTEIASALRSGIVLPPVVVRYDGETYWLQDGFHRIAAMVSIGWEETEAEVIPGTLADIQSDFDRMIREMRGKW